LAERRYGEPFFVGKPFFSTAIRPGHPSVARTMRATPWLPGLTAHWSGTPAWRIG
jgi:hypothetical protein